MDTKEKSQTTIDKDSAGDAPTGEADCPSDEDKVDTAFREGRAMNRVIRARAVWRARERKFHFQRNQRFTKQFASNKNLGENSTIDTQTSR